MKLSVRLSADDVAALDEFVQSRGLGSRSAALRQAIRMLRAPELEEDYAAAWDEWDSSVDGTLWDGASKDGIVDASR